MSDLKITVGGDIMDEARRRFIDAWHRAERGDHFYERHLDFETWNTLTRVLTAEQADLIGYVGRHEVTSIPQLAAALGRDDSEVRADVQALEIRGLLDTGGGRIRAEFAAIEARITL